MQRLYLGTASVFIAAVCCSFLLSQCSAQSTTVRPYKFGFTIDEQQHRREHRDEKGIVMGEFGFITADGIYHVTVYATDEQGRFRILAMKNYPYESPPKTVDITVKPKPKPSTTTAKPKEDLPHHNFYNEACSGCFLSNGKKEPAKSKGSGETPKTGIRTLSKELPNSSPDKASGTKTTAGGKPSVTGKPTTPTKVTQTQAKVPTTPHIKTTEFKKPTAKTKIATTQTKPPQAANTKGPTQTNTPITKPTPSQTKSTGLNKSITPNVIPKSNTPTNNKHEQKKTPTQVGKILPSSNPVAATTVVRKVVASTTQITPILSTGTNLSNKNTKLAKTPTGDKDIMDLIVNKVLPAAMGGKGVVVKPPGAPSGKNPIGSAGKTPSKSGTPTGSGGNSLAPGKEVNANFNPKTTSSSAGPRGGAGSGSGSTASIGGGDGDLYHFKYLLDYHGHEETGKRNGNKEGNYFAIGDDDVERTIEYVANENGYQPRVNWRKRTDKDNLPKENNLKEYEFVWFYDK